MARYCLFSFMLLFFALSCNCAVILPGDDSIRGSMTTVDNGRHFRDRIPEQIHERLEGLKTDTSPFRPEFGTRPNTDKDDLNTAIAEDVTRHIMQSLRNRDRRMPKPDTDTRGIRGTWKDGQSRGRPGTQVENDEESNDDDSDEDECSESSSSEEESSPRARTLKKRTKRPGSWDRAGGGQFGRGDSERRDANKPRPSKRCSKNRVVTSLPKTVTPFMPMTTTARPTTTVTVTTPQPLPATHAVGATQAIQITRRITESPTTLSITEKTITTEATTEMSTTTQMLTTTEAVNTLGIAPEPK